MKTLAERIKKARTEEGLNQKQLATRIGVTKSTISQWESGLIKKIDAENLLAMADVLGIDPYWLTGYRAQSRKRKDEIRDQSNYIVYRKIHVLPDWESIMSWLENGAIGSNLKTIDKPPVCGKRTYALEVRSDIMTPTFPAHTYIIVDPDKAPSHGSFVVMHIKGWNETTFRKLIIEANNMYLEPLNPSYETINLSNYEYRYCGRVIRLIMDFNYDIESD